MSSAAPARAAVLAADAAPPRHSMAQLARVLQALAGAGLVFAFVLALRRPVRAESNVGASAVWLLWWPVVPFLALAAGRLWCAACPFAALADLTERVADRLVPWRRRAPGAAVRVASAWWLPAAIALLGVAFLALGLEMSGPLTAAVLALFAAGSAGLALALRGRAWCRYACPLGATLGLYARFSVWMLRPAAAGARPRPFRCPALLSPLRAIDPRHCQLCARCYDAGAARIARQQPGGTALAGALGGLGGADAALAVALAGVLVADTVRMTPLFLGYIGVALAVVGPAGYRLAVALLPLLGIAAVAATLGVLVMLVAAAARLTGGWRAGWREGAAALVPVAFAAQLGLSLQHLAGSAGPTLQALAVELLPVPWSGHIPPSEAYSVLLPLKAVQLALIVVPAAAAALAWRRPVARGALATGAAGFAAMFALPMSLAC